MTFFTIFLVAPAGLPAAHSFALNQNSFGPQTKMLSIGKVVDELDKKGKKPGSPNYATAVKNEILFHFEIDGKDLDDSTKLESKAKNIAKKCKDLFTSAQTIKKMFDVDKNKVRLFKIPRCNLLCLSRWTTLCCKRFPFLKYHY